MTTTKIKKRDGSIVEFNKGKIVTALTNAFGDTKKGENKELIQSIADTIEMKLAGKESSVEKVQDLCETYLMRSERTDIAKKYILYRNERSKARPGSAVEKFKFLSSEFLSKYKHRAEPFPTEMGKFVYYRTYSRPVPEENRREVWWETVARVVEFNSTLEEMALKKQGFIVDESEINRLRESAENIYDMIYELKLFPSGRSLWVGNTPSSYEYPLSNFNCSAVVIDDLKKFSEILFVLTLGTGAGLSVERKYIEKLPKINTKMEIIHKDYEGVPAGERTEYTELRQKSSSVLEISVGDSKFGWSRALELYLEVISSKQYGDIEFILFNYDNVRPVGERLKTFGGFASGHHAIKNIFSKIDHIFSSKKEANGLQWQTVEPVDALDIATIVAEGIVSGGTRRSALIVFCDEDEKAVLEAKSNLYAQDDQGNWTSNEKILHRMLSNNTVFYYEKPDREKMHNHFETMKISGEPAMANMTAMKKRREDVTVGNPCFEIMLRDRGVCNLTEINLMGFVEEDGTYNREEMMEAQRLSGVIGYRMATIELELHEWNLVNEEDRLTGCSITGVMDFVNATGIDDEEFRLLLQDLRKTAQDATYDLADKLGLNRPKLVTAVKPSGTISQLPTVSSGVHFSHSPYFIRRVRVNSSDPLASAMTDLGFRWEPEVGQTVEEHSTKVFEFPIQAPEGRTKYDVGAIEQLELYKTIMTHYVDHNASNTVHVREGEWDDVEEWIFNNWDDVVGVTFLSLDDNFYQLQPYEAITKEEYEEMVERTPTFDISALTKYENFAEEFDILDSDCDSGVCPIR